LRGTAEHSVQREKDKRAAETPPEPTEKERVQDRITAGLIDSNARSRVKSGLYDPSYAAMGHAFFDAWDPNRALTKDLLKLLGRNTGESLRQWQEAGHNYAKTGSAMVSGRDFVEPTQVRPEGSTVGDDAAREHAAYGHYVNGDFTQGHTAHVLVDESPEKLVVKLVESSGDMAIDNAAIEDVRNALERVRRTDPEARQRKRKSLWAMRLQIIINPPVPMIGVTFDEVLLPPKLELPLGKRLLKHVELEAVYDDDPRLKATGGKTPPG
jgi:hypothetical protein